MRYNKGEWSEAYAFIKLIGDGEVYAADEKLDKIEDKYYPILKVFRDEINTFYETDKEKGSINIINYEKNITNSIDSKVFLEMAELTLNRIKNAEGRSFEIIELENFLLKLGITNFKGSSKKKEDIKMEILDLYINSPATLTFSIKSELGSKPTILNASKSTNFLFEINGITPEEVKELNDLKNTEDKWLKLKFNKIFNNFINNTYEISLVNEKDEIFYQNLRLIDSNLPAILSFILLYFYSHERSTSISDLTEKLIEFNPLNLNDDEKENFYKKNIFEFIKAVTFGMMPNKKWNGNYEISGGLLTVKKEGEILAYHIFYDEEALNTYLFNQTKLESPSTSRHEYGEIFEENEKFFFKLNLQLRFK